jgi:AGZA family xanthine/uracil permease-like MFS transporter
MGGRAAYTLATAVFIGTAGLLGWFTHLFEWLPEAVAFPLLVFIGLEIAAQSFRATPERHYAAVAFAVLPALAYLALIPLDMALAGRPIDGAATVTVQALRCLAAGFIVTSLLWASALAAMLDGKLIRAAGYLAVAAACSLFGIIHSPLQPPVIALPGTVVARMPHDPAILCQTPYHWAAAYVLSAVVLILLSRMHGGETRNGIP